VWRKNTEITKLLIDKGADVNIINKEGQTMIILSVGADNVEISRMLCEAGADVDIQDQMGMSAYGYASLFKKQALLEVLEKYHKEG
ncbi:MAG: ankyrin repeat domain-containing protein, partial [Treponema sp.]|nr:ankyrin repeat domain-containing protein [Treponema sp.]